MEYRMLTDSLLLNVRHNGIPNVNILFPDTKVYLQNDEHRCMYCHKAVIYMYFLRFATCNQGNHYPDYTLQISRTNHQTCSQFEFIICPIL